MQYYLYMEVGISSANCVFLYQKYYWHLKDWTKKKILDSDISWQSVISPSVSLHSTFLLTFTTDCIHVYETKKSRRFEVYYLLLFLKSEAFKWCSLKVFFVCERVTLEWLSQNRTFTDMECLQFLEFKFLYAWLLLVVITL